MKINIITGYFPPEKGAASNRIFNMAKELQNRGCDIQIITTFPNYPTGKIFAGYKGLSKDEVIDGLKVRRQWLYPSNSKSSILRIISMLSFSMTMFFSTRLLRKRRADITIVNSPPLFTGFAGVILARLVGKKVVVNISDIWPLSALELGAIKRGMFYSILEWQEKCIYKKADLCISQSEETRLHIREVVAGKNVLVYRNLSKSNHYESEIVVKNSKRIIYAGLLGVAQGVLRIVENVKFGKLGVELHIYGSGNETEKIKQYISDNSDCNVFYHGLVSPVEVDRLLPQFDASLIPLINPIYGAFPSKIFVAMAAGLPIIFSGEGEGARFVKDHKLGFVNPSNDLKLLQSNIIRLSQLTKDEQHQIRSNSEQLIANDFSYNKNQEVLFEQLQKLVNG